MLLQQIDKSTLTPSPTPVDLSDLPIKYMNPGELDVLVALVRSGPHRRVIEFGCNLGRTAKVLLREIPTIMQYVGIDVLPGYQPEMRTQRREIPQNPGILAADDHRFSLILRENGTLDLGPDDLRWADVVFIDGDHSYKVVMRDTVLATKVLTPRGIIICTGERGSGRTTRHGSQDHPRGRYLARL